MDNVDYDKELNFLRGIQWVFRSNGQPKLLGNYSIVEHGANCVMLYMLVQQISHEALSPNMMKILLLHDGIEKYTGDVLYPAKQVIADTWATVEAKVADDYVNPDERKMNLFVYTDDDIKNELSESEYKLFKFIDMCEYFLRTSEEFRAGNHHPEVLQGLTNAFHVLRKLAIEFNNGNEGINYLMRNVVLIYSDEVGFKE